MRHDINYICPYCDEKTERPLDYCPNCGSKLEADEWLKAEPAREDILESAAQQTEDLQEAGASRPEGETQDEIPAEEFSGDDGDEKPEKIDEENVDEATGGLTESDGIASRQFLEENEKPDEIPSYIDENSAGQSPESTFARLIKTIKGNRLLMIASTIAILFMCLSFSLIVYIFMGSGSGPKATETIHPSVSLTPSGFPTATIIGTSTRIPAINRITAPAYGRQDMTMTPPVELSGAIGENDAGKMVTKSVTKIPATSTLTSTLPPTLTSTPEPTSLPLPLFRWNVDEIANTDDILPEGNISMCLNRNQPVVVYYTNMRSHLGGPTLVFLSDENVWNSLDYSHMGEDEGRYNALTLGYDDKVRLVFSRQGTNGNGEIVYSVITGDTSMGFYQYNPQKPPAEDVDIFGLSMVDDRQGMIHLAFYDQSTSTLKSINYPLQGIDIDVAEFNSRDAVYPIQLDLGGVPNIVYYDEQEGLMLAHVDGAHWEKELILAGKEGMLMPSFLIDRNDGYHIAFHDEKTAGLVYLYRNDSDWKKIQIDTAGTGVNSSMAVSNRGLVYISYYDMDNGDLKLAMVDPMSESKHVERVDGQNTDVGFRSVIALDGQNLPRIVYLDSSHNCLKYAYSALE